MFLRIPSKNSGDVRGPSGRAPRAGADDGKDGGAEPAARQSAPLVAHSDTVFDVAWSAEGRFLLSAGGDGACALWDAAAPGHAADDGGADDAGPAPPGAALQRYEAHSTACWGVAWPDGLGSGRVFATCGADRTARLFDTARAEPVRVFAGHWSDVRGAARPTCPSRCPCRVLEEECC